MHLAIVQYTDNVPSGFGGVTYGPWVRILPKYREDAGLLQHELEHVKQFWISLLAAAPWLYTLFAAEQSDLLRGYAVAVGLIVVSLFAMRKGLILQAEVAAYRVQLKVSVESKNLSLTQAETRAKLFAGFIATKYRLDITPDAALKLITD